MWNLAKRWKRQRRAVPPTAVRRSIGPERLEPRCLMAANPLQVGLVYLETDYLDSADDRGSDNLPDRFLLSFTGGAPGSELKELRLSTDKDGDGLSVGDLIFDTAGGGRGKGGSHPFRIVNINAADPRATVTGTVDDGGQLLTLRLTHFRAGDTVEFSLDVDEVLRLSDDLAVFNSRLDEIVSGQEFQDSILSATFTAPHYETATAQDVFLNDYGDPHAEYGLNLPPDVSDDPNSRPNRSAAAIAATVQVPKPVSISGAVFVDDNLNLRRDSGEKSLSGVLVSLWRQDDSGQFVDTGLSTRTDAAGRYSFGTDLGLMPGTYRVAQTQPSGYFSVGAIAGTVDGTATGTPEGFDVLTDIALPLGDLHAIDFDFAEARPAELSGYVYRDDDDDGVRDAGEPGLANVRVRLVPIDTINPQQTRVTKTAADGSYRFENLAPGRYQIIELDQPAPLTDGLDTPGTVDGRRVGEADNPGDAIRGVVLAGGSVARDYNFGELPLGSLSGYVYLAPPGEDCTDGAHHHDSTPLADVVVKLYDDSGAFIAETRTAADGSYRFDNLPKGTYRLQEITPEGLLDGTALVGAIGGVTVGELVSDGSIRRIRLPAGKEGVGYDFCEAAPASVSGYVYHDASNDGRRGNGETGIAGVRVQLVDESGKVVATAHTDAKGRYEFRDLLPGTYRILESTPDGYFDGLDSAGTVASVTIGAAVNPGDLIQGVELLQGQIGVEYNFGELLPARIEGIVHADVDGDCVLDEGESPIAGVSMRLLDASGREVARTTTDAEGRYVFDGLRPGRYTIVQDQPEGYFTGGQRAGSTGGDASVTNRISGVQVGSDIVSIGNDFCEKPPSQLSGTVYADRDADEVRDAGEVGIEGVRIELLDAEGRVVATTTTNAQGRYQFTNLRAGQYTVRETQPTGFLQGGQRAGSGGGNDSQPDLITEIGIGWAENLIHYDFSELEPSSIQGIVFVDANGDGVHQPAAGERTLRGVTIRLHDADGKVIATTKTGANGGYRFDDLRPGQYRVSEVQPEGLFHGGQRAGSGGGVASRDLISQINVTPALTLVDYDFYEFDPSSIQGTVFVDANGDGIRQPASGERILSGVTIRLHDADGKVIATTKTDADGHYRFENLRRGEYRISEVQPEGLFHGGQRAGSAGGVASKDLIRAIPIVPGQALVDYDFYELDPSSIGGIVFVDSDGDGVRKSSAGERALSGVTIRLHDESGAVIATMKTDAQGRYRFDNLPPGQYRVSEVQPEGLFHGGQRAGSAGGVISEDSISQIPIGPGQTLVDYNFYELDPSSIEGIVFVDSNGDGIYKSSPGERTLSGVTIRLHHETGEVIATTKTDAQGRYHFAHLPPGQYRISELQPQGLFHGGQRVGSGGGVATKDLISEIEIGPGQTLVEYNFFELDPSSIEGTVFVDSNGNGVFNSGTGDRTLGGVTIRLHDADGNVIATTKTDAHGGYRFDNLRGGQYRISEVQPEGLFHGGQRAGSGGGVATRDLISHIQVGPGQTLVDYDFYELEPSSIEGIVFVDANADGVFNSAAGDRTLAGVTIRLHDTAGKVVATTKTDSRGAYRFDNLRGGQYRVSEVQPEGYFQGGQRVGSGGGVASEDAISQILVGPGQRLVDYDFHELLGSTLRGSVWADTDLDKRFDAGEKPLSSVPIELIDAAGKIIATTRTDAAGNYEFRDIAPGVYSVRQSQPAGYFHGGQVAGSHGGDDSRTDLVAAITIPSNAILVGYNFPEVPPAKISGHVFQDGPAIKTDTVPPPEKLRDYRDGSRKASDTPLAGVVLELRNVLGEPFDASRALPGSYADGPIRVVTGANGYYEFVGLRPGTYHVYQVQPDGYIDGLDTPGSAGGMADNAADLSGNPELQFVLHTLAASEATNPRRDAILNISLGAGGAATDNNFSEIVIAPPPVVAPQEFPIPDVIAPPAVPIESFPSFDLVFGSGTPAYLKPAMMGDHNTAVTWHLSVINGGFPRGEGISDGATIRQVSSFEANLQWSEGEANRGHWQLFDLEGKSVRSSESLTLGVAEGIPMVADFNGDGRDDLAVFIAGQWLVDLNGDGRWDSGDLWIQLGTELDRPVVGDWDGDGKADVGIFGPQWNRDPEAIKEDPGLPAPDNQRRRRPKNAPPTEAEAPDGRRFLRRTSRGPLRADLIDHVFRYGRNPDTPLAGDWIGDGIHTIAVFRAGEWLLDSDGDGRWTERDEKVQFGQVGDDPVVGDWNGDGIDDLGVVRGDLWIIDSDGDRRITDADARIRIARGKDDLPIAGDWNGDGRDQPGLYRAGGEEE